MPSCCVASEEKMQKRNPDKQYSGVDAVSPQFMSSAGRVGGHRRVAALELMKRDAARTRTGPNAGADTHLFCFFSLSRIPSGQPAVGFRGGLTGHTFVRC